ncbi:MAG: sugar ABC transporter permease [Lachnospiraceae bacterium]|nr:sugar ABC transporter permease [Lachnospiraceae bacterium]
MNNSKSRSLKKHQKATNTIVYIVLVIASIVWITPFVMIVLESFKGETTMPQGYVAPKTWSLVNYKALFDKERMDFTQWYVNTLIMSFACAVIQTFMVLCMSYTLSRMRFKGRKFLMNFMLVLGMFPGFLSMIILKKVLSGWGMIGENSVAGLILVYTASSAMGYYVSKGFFDTIPKSLDEAARVDGATRAMVFFQITLPMAKPIVIYTLLTAFMGPWGDFMFAKYICNNTSKGMNVAVGLQNMIATSEGLAAHYTHFCAAGVLVAIPVTILFMCLQRYYVEGVTGGAVKG